MHFLRSSLTDGGFFGEFAIWSLYHKPEATCKVTKNMKKKIWNDKTYLKNGQQWLGTHDLY